MCPGSGASWRERRWKSAPSGGWAMWRKFASQAEGLSLRRRLFVRLFGVLAVFDSLRIHNFGHFAQLCGHWAGKLRVLAISSENRVPGIDVPTLKEAGVDVSLNQLARDRGSAG